MLKRRSILSAVVAMLVFFAVGCGKEQQPVTSGGSQQQPVATVAETTPAKVEEPTATPTPEATPTPTEAPTPTVDPLTIPSLDQFEEYDGKDRTMFKILNEVKYEDPVVIVIEEDMDTYKAEIAALLSDGDSFEEANKVHSYFYFIYTPKDSSGIEFDEQKLIGFWNDTSDGEYKYDKCLFANFEHGATGENVETTFDITYVDGTEDSITIYVTR